jgi:hypothetical protein
MKLFTLPLVVLTACAVRASALEWALPDTARFHGRTVQLRQAPPPGPVEIAVHGSDADKARFSQLISSILRGKAVSRADVVWARAKLNDALAEMSRPDTRRRIVAQLKAADAGLPAQQKMSDDDIETYADGLIEAAKGDIAHYILLVNSAKTSGDQPAASAAAAKQCVDPGDRCEPNPRHACYCCFDGNWIEEGDECPILAR